MIGSSWIFCSATPETTALCRSWDRSPVGADDDALQVQPLDLGRPGAEGDVGHGAELDRTAILRLHRQVLDRIELGAGILLQRHADRDLAIGQREFGAVLVDIAQSRDADRGRAALPW